VRSELADTVGVVPNEILLLRQNTIPRTSSGKIQRGACRASFLDGTLEVIGRWRPDRESQRGVADPMPSIHEFLLTWVREELEIEPSKLLADTPLLELGIDSLAATRLVVALEARLGRRVEVAELWSQPSVGALAQHLAALQEADPPGGGPTTPAFRVRPPAEPDRVTDFAHWPEYRALRARLDMLEGQGIESPFFQVHEGVTGSHAMIDGRRVLNFANYNYLGLSGDPDVTRAAQDAVARWGSSVSASRVVSGERPIHAALEREIARFIGVDDAIVFIGGHPANVSTISHLFATDDVILCDALMHNSAVQGAEFSGARRLTFPHNDWRTLDTMLQRVRGRHRRALIVLEGVYSADGDVPDLRRFVEVKERHGAMLMVDEAHSLGVLGATGRGIAEHAGVDPAAVDIWMGTLSKSLASCGGYIAGSSALVEYLKYTAPGFVYSVGIPPSNAAAALAALQKLIAEPSRVAALRERAAYFLRRCREEGLDTAASGGTPVIPVIVGDSLRAAKLSAMLLRGRCQRAADGGAGRAERPRAPAVLRREHPYRVGDRHDRASRRERDARARACRRRSSATRAEHCRRPANRGRGMSDPALRVSFAVWPDDTLAALVARSEVVVCSASLTADAALVTLALTLLDPKERERFDQYENKDVARRFAMSRFRLREMLATLLAIPPRAVPLQIGLHGKPALGRRLHRRGSDSASRTAMS
jgi:7-keto-8-aminopelargonate synthetase-like enzyme/acyl carrier protein